ncbi:DNA helicase [Tanacetum coccineum]
MKTKRKLAPKSVVSVGHGDVGNSKASLPLAEGVGHSKRRCVRQLGDEGGSNTGIVNLNEGNANAVFRNLNEGHQCLPINGNVDISDQQTLPEDVDALKRNHLDELGTAGPSQSIHDRRILEVSLNMNANVPYQGGQCLTMNTNVAISGQQILADDVGSSKRRRINQMNIAGPSLPMHDRPVLEVFSDVNANVPDLQVPGAQHLRTYGSVSLSNSDPDQPGVLLERLRALVRIGDRSMVVDVRVDGLRCMFSMTSLGAHIDDSVNNGRGPYVFKISGQLYHWLGSLCPAEGEPPCFLQLYIYDTDNEVDNRMSHFGGQNSDLRRDIVEGLIDMLDTHNALVHLFRTAREKLADTHIPNFKVRLYNVVGAREYALPTGDMLAAIVYKPGPQADIDYDIVIEERSGHPQRVNKLHSSYMSLQFPLLFPYGKDEYSKDLKLLGGTDTSDLDRRLTMEGYYAYVIHDRANCFNYLSRAGRLFQQYVVTAFCAIEQNRIDYVREHQNDIRNEYLSGIYDAINRGDNDGSDCGARLILPQSFVGGPRYMYSHYLDALAICRVHGNPSFFVTFTCNVKWSEITDYMAEFPLLTTTDRADIPFGRVVAVLYTVEFQKRGLPHWHTLVWLHEASRIHRDKDIDAYVSAELPSIDADPKCHRILSELMMHGPCGLAYPSAACIQNATECRNYFPNDYCNGTYTDKDGFVHYRRRDTGVTTMKQHVENRIAARISRNQSTAHDSTSRPQIVVDEIKNYLDLRYISPHEACWRMLEFDIHYRQPAVQILYIHLQNMQRVVFRDKDKLNSVVVNTHIKKTTLTEWLYYNEWNTDGRHLTYLDFPFEFVWNSTGKYWSRRRQRYRSSIGSMSSIIKEAACTATPAELRTLFAHILAFCQVTDPFTLWKRVWTNDSQLEDNVLYELEGYLNHCSRSLIDFGMRLPSEDLMSVLRNRLLMEEKSYNRELLAREKERLMGKLNEKQRRIFDLIMNACTNNQQELIFIYGHGGTGKTFLWKAVTYTLRAEGKIVLAVASSGVASLLLLTGRTTHSWFKLPLDLTDTYVSPMNDRRCFETLDRTLRDILDTPNAFFGGKSVMLGGDFRQTLPVKKNASRNEIIGSLIAESYLWRHFKLCRLTENTRLSNDSMNEADREKVAMFAKWLLDIGDGHLGTPDELDPENTSWVDIPDDYRIPDDENGLVNLIKFIYDDHTLQHPTPRTPHVYQSYDEALPHGHDGGEVELLYPREYLNTLSFTELPPHKLELKIGTPIILLRNINIVDGLCNGTRLIVKQLLPKLGATYIISGFSCQKTPTWERTLQNDTSLICGRYLQVHNIPNDNFPHHYFDFVAYNELAGRANVRDAVLTVREVLNLEDIDNGNGY